MPPAARRTFVRSACGATLGALAFVTSVLAQSPSVDVVFPASAAAGRVTELQLSGSALSPLKAVRTSIPGATCELLPDLRLRLTVPDTTRPGYYDLWCATAQGASSPRTLVIGRHPDQLEVEPNQHRDQIQRVATPCAIHGRLAEPGDIDRFAFAGKKGERVVIDVAAERIDSRLRAVLELFDSDGTRLAVNRGYHGADPQLDFTLPHDGVYSLALTDLVGSGGAQHVYRVELDNGPRVAFALPAAVERGKPAQITLFGWNLHAPSQRSEASPVIPTSSSNATPRSPAPLESLEVTLPAERTLDEWPLPLRLTASQLATSAVAYHLPGSSTTIPLAVVDSPVEWVREPAVTATRAHLLSIPSDLTAQFLDDNDLHWFRFDARRGEVFGWELFGQRWGSPVDLDLRVLDGEGRRELARFRDDVRGIGASEFGTPHLDPVGLWVAPADGQYLLLVRDLRGGSTRDPRRVYRLSARRADASYALLAAPRSDLPVGLTVARGGRERIELFLSRQPAHEGTVRVALRNPPPGVTADDCWIGPGADRGILTLSAAKDATWNAASLQLEARDESTESVGRLARAGTIVRSGTPVPWTRLSAELPLVVADSDAPLRITANAHEPLDHHLYGRLSPRHSPGGVVDIAVDLERRSSDHAAPVKLTVVGLPPDIANAASVVPAGDARGYLSLYLPPTRPTGKFSCAILAETTVPGADGKPQAISIVSNSVTIAVEPAAFLVELDPFAPRQARRGETIQVRYTARRRHGFIGKMHTELAMPGKVTDVTGLRGRGETFVGQTESGVIQIVVNDDAPLGKSSFLRFFTVGVVEDQPTYFGAAFYPLEIVE